MDKSNNKAHFITFLASCFLALYSSSTLADSCENWFANQDIDSSSPNCELDCSIAPVDMGTFGCHSECDKLCDGNSKSTFENLNSENSCTIPANSRINPEEQSLIETIPLVGIPFTLNYSSLWFRTDSENHPNNVHFGGWSPSVYWAFDPDTQTLWGGDGSHRKVSPIEFDDGGFIIPDRNGKYFISFDENQRWQYTIDAITGKVYWQASYDDSGQLSKIYGAGQLVATIVFTYSRLDPDLKTKITITSAGGKDTILSFDENGWLSKVQNPSNEVYKVKMADPGLLVELSNPLGEASIKTYDRGGRLTKDVGPYGDFFSLLRTIQDQKQIVKMETALGRTTILSTELSKDRKSSLRSIVDPIGIISKRVSSEHLGENQVLDSFGGKITYSITDDQRFQRRTGYTSKLSFTFLNLGYQMNTQKFLSVDPENSFIINHLQEIKTISSADLPDRTIEINFDRGQSVWSFLSPEKRTTHIFFNKDLLPEKIKNSQSQTINYSYDPRGNTSLITQGEAPWVIVKAKYQWDEERNLLQKTDALGSTWNYTYDKSNRLIDEQLPDGAHIVRTYDSLNRVTSITPPGRNQHLFSYALMDLVASYLPPKLANILTGAIYNSWNLDGQLTETQGDGWRISYQYNSKSGQLENIQSPRGVSSFSYYQNSNQIKEVHSPEGITIKYTYIGPWIKTVQTEGPIPSNLEYEYYSDGSLKRLNLAKAFPIDFKYDLDSLPIKVGDETIKRNELGLPIEVSVMAIKKTIIYDSNGNIQSELYQGPSSLIALTYKRDRLSRIVEKQTSVKEKHGANDPGFNENEIKQYSYDNGGRLNSISKNGQVVHSYSYESNGIPISPDLKFDDQDRITDQALDPDVNKADDTTHLHINYNNDGSVASMTKSDLDGVINSKMLLRWEPMGALASAQIIKTQPNSHTDSIEYVLDVGNRRLGKKVNNQLVKGWIYQNEDQILAETDGQGNVEWQFVWGTKLSIPDLAIKNGRTFLIVSDQIGSPLALLDAASGELIARYRFDEWGNEILQPSEAFELPFGFAGGLRDRDTNLVRFGHRDYDPSIGRWVSRDPILFNGWGYESLWVCCQ